MSEYLELPWSVEDTINNLKELKDGLQERCIIRNLHGRGEKDAEEIAFDFDRAIKALEEIKQYRAIGTIEECRAAVEKQKAKKIVRVKLRQSEWGSEYRCPVCESDLIKTVFFNKDGTEPNEKISWCSGCGQKLDWRDEE